MTSTFGWMDYSERTRRRMLDALSQLDEKETRDELGLAAIRDSFADQLFPGTSTIMTRARYFFFVPWMYQVLEAKGGNEATVERRARTQEIALIDVLESAGESEGVIGRQSRGALKRLPSSIYWAGLIELGILRFRGGQGAYHRCVDELARRRRIRHAGDEDGAGLLQSALTWDPNLPKPPPSFPREASLDLTRREAEYFVDRVRAAAPHSLLCFLLEERQASDRVDFLWQHPATERAQGELSALVADAEKFSLALHGAALLYNLMLAEGGLELGIGDGEVLERWRRAYEEALRVWCQTPELERLEAWNLDQFWRRAAASTHAITIRTRAFVSRWLAMTPWAGWSTATSSEVRALVVQRESEVKGARARLGRLQALEVWSGASGAGRMDFRWGVGQRVLNDVLFGMGVSDVVE
ncbi:MAG: DUF6361 family protein [Polyangiaceae bacterium]